MNHKIYCKNNIKISNQENNDLILKQYLEKYRVYTDDGINSLKNIADAYDLTNKKSILFIGVILGERHVRRLLYKNIDSYFITIDSLECEHYYNFIFEHKANNIPHWFGSPDPITKTPNYDFIIACCDCDNIFDTIYIDSGVIEHIQLKTNIFPILFKLLKLNGVIYIEENAIDFILPYNKEKKIINHNYNSKKGVIQYSVNNIYFYEKEHNTFSEFNYRFYNYIPMKQLLESIYKFDVKDCGLTRPLHYSKFIKCTKTQEVDNLYPLLNDTYKLTESDGINYYTNLSNKYKYKTNIVNNYKQLVIFDKELGLYEIYNKNKNNMFVFKNKQKDNLAESNDIIAFNKIFINLILAKNTIKIINTNLKKLCNDMYLFIKLQDNIITLELWFNTDVVSSIYTNPINDLSDNINISSLTHKDYRQNKYNKFMRAVFIYIAGMIKINGNKIEKINSIAANWISAYLLSCFYNTDILFSSALDNDIYNIPNKSCKEKIEEIKKRNGNIFPVAEITVPLSQDNISKAKTILYELLDPTKNHLICSKIKLD